MPQFIVIPDQLPSLLTAVNVCISAIGEAPVAGIDPPPTSEVDSALIALDQADLDHQAKGWSWNKEKGYPLALDLSGYAVLPAQTLEVEGAYFTSSQVLDIVQRGNKLYDRANHTFVFETAPTVDLVVRQPWDNIPAASRRLITLTACQRFIGQFSDRSMILRVNSDDITKAEAVVEQYEDRVSQPNSISGNVSVQGALSGFGGMRRNRT